MYTKHELCEILAQNMSEIILTGEELKIAVKIYLSKSNSELIEKLLKHGLKFELVGNLFKPIYK